MFESLRVSVLCCKTRHCAGIRWRHAVTWGMLANQTRHDGTLRHATRDIEAFSTPDKGREDFAGKLSKRTAARNPKGEPQITRMSDVSC